MTTLPTITNNLSYEQIAQMTGQEMPSKSTSTLKVLKINRDFEDDDGNALPSGTFTVNADGENIYAKTITFQLFMQRYQYIHYDQSEGEFVGKSIMANNLYPQTEVPDSIGTMRCGSVPSAKRENLTVEQATKQKDIKCYRMLFGKVTFNDAVNAKGDKRTVEDMPILWKARGANFMPISVPLDALTAQSKNFIFYNMDVSLKKEKNGSVIYYVGVFSPPKGPLDFTESDQQLLIDFDSYIKAENKDVMKDYDSALRSVGNIVDVESTTVTMDDVLNDDLPESMAS
jgi:hypothetical protein